MVRKLGQGHGDGHPLMPQHGAEPSLSSSPSDATRLWSPARISHEKRLTVQKKRQRATCLSLVVVVVLVVLVVLVVVVVLVVAVVVVEWF